VRDIFFTMVLVTNEGGYPPSRLTETPDDSTVLKANLLVVAANGVRQGDVLLRAEFDARQPGPPGSLRPPVARNVLYFLDEATLYKVSVSEDQSRRWPARLAGSILSWREVARFFAAIERFKDRALLMTAYAAGYGYRRSRPFGSRTSTAAAR
jgi:integrase